MEGKRRVCHIQRGDSGFGFILCCENATTDTYVLHVLKSSPASRAKLSPGDRIIEVNGLNVEREPHKEVVERLQGLQSVKLIVAHSRAAEEYFKTPGNGMTVKPLDDANELRPKLVTVTRTSSGFDFVLQTVGKSPKMSTGKYRQQLKGIAGHYVGTLDRDGVAYKAGLRQGHRLLEINGTSIEQESHSYVIAVIRASHTVKLLVVDEDTDEFFLRHGISPSAKHLAKLDTFPCRYLKENSTASYNLTGHEIFNPGKPIERTRPFISSPMPYYDVTRSPSSLSDIALMRKMAMSTPDLSTFGKSTSQSPGFANPSIPSRKERSKVKKRFSLFDKKKKSGFYKSSVDLASGRKLYDETIISDSETPKGSPPAPIHEQPDIVNDVTRRNGTPITFGGNEEQTKITSLKTGASPPLKPSPKLVKQPHAIPNHMDHVAGYESPPPGYESPDDLSTVGYKVDLKTLKDHVRKRSGKSSPGKPLMRNYALAHHAVNGY
ncbi:uncharacterized protein LOC100179793 [Ciona intestinalis]